MGRKAPLIHIRLVGHIDRLFGDLIEQTHGDLTVYNRLVGLKADVVAAFIQLLSEADIKKKYGVDVDYLTSARRRPSMADGTNPYWVDVQGPQTGRPPGPTVEEVNRLMRDVEGLFGACEAVLRSKVSDEHDKMSALSSLLRDTTCAIRDAFILPNSTVPTRPGVYVRTSPGTFITATTIQGQTLPCMVCGESRTLDVCHIVSRAYGGGDNPGNVLLLCPTHHRLFDSCSLAEDEWRSIGWSGRSKAATNYAYYVILPRLQEYWASAKTGLNSRQLRDSPVTQTSNEIERCRDKALAECLSEVLELVKRNPGATQTSICASTSFAESLCASALTKLEADGLIVSAGKTKRSRSYHPILGRILTGDHTSTDSRVTKDVRTPPYAPLPSVKQTEVTCRPVNPEADGEASPSAKRQDLGQ